MMKDDWHGCYDDGWKGLLYEDKEAGESAFSHPAKFSHGLIKRIYQHLLAEGAVQPGDTVVDPFGGVALGSLYAMQNGLNWIGCELEAKFVELGGRNIALWNSRYAAHFPRWGTARLLQGDSRRLASVVAVAGCVVCSPPYADGAARNGGADPKPERMQGGKLGVVVEGYGDSSGQLGKMSSGSLAAVVTSPPFAGNTGGRGEASRNGIDAALFDRHGGGMKGGTGSDPRNLDNLPQGSVGAVVGSPPFEKQIPAQDTEFFRQHRAEMGRNPNANGGTPLGYGSAPGQLGNDSGETFWFAARLIVEQCALLLPPGGWAVWVVKDYVKAGAIVPFSDQWRQLCEVCGFETVHIHRAWLVKDGGTQADIFGGVQAKKVERKSFFRRLAESRQKMVEHWKTLSRPDKARALREGKADLWRAYRATQTLPDSVDDLDEAESLSGKKNPLPNRSRILSNAQSIAWTRDGKPDYEITTAINWETVICTRRTL